MDKHRIKDHIIANKNKYILLLSIPLLVLDLFMLWVLITWKQLTMEQLLFQITSESQGTAPSIVFSAVLSIIIPIAIVVVSFLILTKKYPVICWFYSGGVFIFTVGIIIISIVRLDLFNYLNSQSSDSDFIASEYVDPQSIEIEFPEKKRNLIYIYLESMEITYSDVSDGGAFSENIIPGLTEIARENECFSDGKSLNGCNSISGTTWTTGAMWASISGLPMKSNVGTNNMSTQDHFYPSVTTMGDILYNEGYTNELLIGSSAVFGGRDKLFEDHGDYLIRDYDYARKNGWISKDHKVFWGYEDEKLFEFARRELQSLSSTDNPFNLSLLTVDTHFEDGYVCELCDDEYGNDQYANVMACSSRQVTEFINWCRDQVFYDNTTIVLCGDHLTMDSDFCKEVPGDYTRKSYVSIINSAAQRGSQTKREYCIFDLFPTTLASLNCTIEGERIGLGTNLYSDTETLIERYGLTEANANIAHRSDFMASMDNTDLDLLIKGIDYKLEAVPVSDSSSDVRINVTTGDGFDNVEIRLLFYDDIDKNDCLEVDCEKTDNNVFTAIVNADKYKYFTIEFRVPVNDDRQFGKSTEEQMYEISLAGAHQDFRNYLMTLNHRMDQDNIAVFISAYDDCVTALEDTDRSLLKDLGLKTVLDSAYFRNSYLAVVEGKKVIVEKNSENYIEEAGVLSDGASFEIGSAGFYSTSKDNSFVSIDGDFHKFPCRGLNFVVYDLANRLVVDKASFDTYSGENLKTWGFEDYYKLGEEQSVNIDYRVISDLSLYEMVIDTENTDEKLKVSSVSLLQRDKDGKIISKRKFENNGDGKYSIELGICKGQYNYYCIGYADDNDQYSFEIESETPVFPEFEVLHKSFYDYLRYVKTLDSVYLLLAVADDGSSALTDYEQDMLHDLDLVKTVKGEEHFRNSYIAVVKIDNGVPHRVFEDLSDERIDYSGTLVDGASLEIISAGFDVGNTASIVIDDTDHAAPSRGFNIAVYDYEDSMILDSCCFDTFSGDYGRDEEKVFEDYYNEAKLIRPTVDCKRGNDEISASVSFDQVPEDLVIEKVLVYPVRDGEIIDPLNVTKADKNDNTDYYTSLPDNDYCGVCIELLLRDNRNQYCFSYDFGGEVFGMT